MKRMTRREFSAGMAKLGALATLSLPAAAAIAKPTGRKRLYFAERGIFFRQGAGPWIDITDEKGGFTNRLQAGDRIIVCHHWDESRAGKIVELERVFVRYDGIEAFSSRV